jgi:hypothetical protein
VQPVRGAGGQAGARFVDHVVHLEVQQAAADVHHVDLLEYRNR